MWNQGGYSEPSLGGYTQSPGGFASPSASQGGEKKGRMRAQQIIPCSVSQLLSSRQAEDVFRVGDVEIAQITLLGIVRATEKSVTNVQYKVDDMTGPPVSVKQWVDGEDTSVESTVFPPGTYVKVFGNLRSFQNHRTVVAFNIRPVEDMNEITSHMLEVVRAHMLLSKPTSAVRALLLLLLFFLLRRRPLLPLSISSSSSSFSSSSSLLFLLVFLLLLLLFLPPAPSPPLLLFLPVPLLPPSSSCVTAGEMCLLLVLSLIRSCPDAQGIHIHDLKQKLSGMSIAVIKQAVEFLCNEGHVFSTIDEEHFRSTDNNE
ncbi:replication protein A 32 kDa subunit [Anguilla rostrata]|uniref:replication protein A 32 kDa subunit n=1 Tax=Anguilla rostrata TaxID=7938 RepID=UPI0030D0B96C